MKIPAWVLLVSVVCLAFSFWQRDAVFPNASLDLKLPKPEIEAKATQWSNKLGYDTNQSLKSTFFSSAETSKTFLEMELGTEKANQVMRDKLPIWFWQTRFCKELQNEEMDIYLTPDGELNAFTRTLDNDHALPSISRGEAQKLAEKFVREKSNLPFDQYSLIESSDTQHPKRTDHDFTWERKMPALSGATLRIDATVSGNEMSHFDSYLKVPEKWAIKYETMRSYNNLLYTIANVFYVLLESIVGFLLVREIAVKSIRWRLAAKLSAVMVVVSLLSFLNDLGNFYSGYDTSLSLTQYATNKVVMEILELIFVFLTCLLTVGVTECFYRKHFADRLKVDVWFNWSTLKTNQMATNLCLGACMFAGVLGWQTAYYLAGEHWLHFYSPLQTNNYELLSGLFPFYYAIMNSGMAAFTEEILYRLFGLTLLTKLCRNFHVANFLQAAAWGFMHSTYAQQPCYVRGLELTCWGMVNGLVMRRYGLIAAVVGHYLFDAYVYSDVLTRSSLLPIKLSGLLPTVPLIVLAVISFFFSRKSVQDEAALTNESLPAMAPAPTLEIQRGDIFEAYVPLSPRNRRILSVIAAFSIAASGLLWSHAKYAGSKAKLEIDRQQALVAATKVMQQRHIDISGYSHVVWLTSDTEDFSRAYRYIAQKFGKQKAKELADKCALGFTWNVRFFKPLVHTEYNVGIDGVGRFVDLIVTLPEEAAEAMLSEKEARNVVEPFLKEVPPFAAPLEFESVSEIKRDNRTDFTFTFKAPAIKMAEASYKVTASAIGKLPSGPVETWELPDKWLFDESKISRRRHIAGICKSVFFIALSLAVVWAAFGVVRAGALKWRIPAIVSLILTVGLDLIPMVNHLQVDNAYYDTSQPYSTFVIDRAVSYVTSEISPFVFTMIAIAVAVAGCRLLVPRFDLPHFLRAAFRPRNDEALMHRTIWTDAIVIGFSFACLSAFFSDLVDYLNMQFLPYIEIDGLDRLVSSTCNYAPFITDIANRFDSGCQFILFAAVASIFCAKYFSKGWQFIVFGTLVAVIATCDYKYVQEIILYSFNRIGMMVIMWFLIARYAKANVLAYFVYAFSNFPLNTLLDSLDHINAVQFLPDTIASCLVPFLPLFYLVYLKFSTHFSFSQVKALPGTANGDNASETI